MKRYNRQTSDTKDEAGSYQPKIAGPAPLTISQAMWLASIGRAV